MESLESHRLPQQFGKKCDYPALHHNSIFFFLLQLRRATPVIEAETFITG